MGGVNTPELSIDDRKQKHVSFDASSLMRSQTLATMDESSFQRAAAGGGVPGGALLPSHSSERLIDSTAGGGSQGLRDSLDFAYISEILPPDLARQLMLERLKRNSMRTQATQTDVNNRARNGVGSSSANGHAPSQFSHHMQRVAMVSESVQTNGGLANGVTPLTPTYKPSLPPAMSSQPQHSTFRPQAGPQVKSQPVPPQSAPRPPVRQSSMQYGSPSKQIPPHIAQQLPGYKLQVYHLDDKKEKCSAGTSTSPESDYPGGYGPPLSHPPPGRRGSQPASADGGETQQTARKHHHHHHHHHHRKLQKSASEGGSLDSGFGTDPRRKQKQHIVAQSMPTTSEDDDLPSDRDMPELAPVTLMSQVPEEPASSPEKNDLPSNFGPTDRSFHEETSRPDPLSLEERDSPPPPSLTPKSSAAEREAMKGHREATSSPAEDWSRIPRSPRDQCGLSVDSDTNTTAASLSEMQTLAPEPARDVAEGKEVVNYGQGIDENEEHDDEDLGQKLSPLGSNSSIPDLVRRQPRLTGQTATDARATTRPDARDDQSTEAMSQMAPEVIRDITTDKMMPADLSEASNTQSISEQSSFSLASPINNEDGMTAKFKTSASESEPGNGNNGTRPPQQTDRKRDNELNRSTDPDSRGEDSSQIRSNQGSISISSQEGADVVEGQPKIDNPSQDNDGEGSGTGSQASPLQLSCHNSRVGDGSINAKERRQIVREMSQIKSPSQDGISVCSSSSGSYSVTTESNNGETGVKETQPLSPAPSHTSQRGMGSVGVEPRSSEDKSKPRRDELKLDLLPSTSSHMGSSSEVKVVGHQEETSALGSQGVSSPSQLTMSSPPSGGSLSKDQTGLEASENSMIWQRVPMGTGDVKKKRQAFEDQIKAQSPQENLPPHQTPPPLVAPKPKMNGSRPGSVKTPMTRKIVNSEMASSPGGLARSPAMHDGFKTEEWVVKRTPINTPAADTKNEENKIIVGIINLSDEEDEAYDDEAEGTSFHIDSEAAFKSGATTPPGGGDDSLRSSLAPSSVDLEMSQHDSAFQGGRASQGSNGDERQSNPISEDESCRKKPRQVSPPQTEEAKKVEDESHPATPTQTEVKQVESTSPEVVPAKSTSQAEASPKGGTEPFVKPPAGFGDSPDKKAPEQPLVAHLLASREPEEILTASHPECSVYQANLPQKEFPASVKIEDSRKSSIDVDPISTQTSSTATGTLEKKRRKESNAPSMVGGMTTNETPTHVTVTANLKHRKKSKSRSRSTSKERLLSKLAHDDTVLMTGVDEDELIGLYVGGYKKTVWAFIGKLNQVESGQTERDPSYPLRRSASIESTQSEREFRKRHQAITHRMVHRKSSAIMYSKILERTFECNKVVTVERIRGEFGFRIHGSRPVVVSAIEPNTPAETSGLEVGDIILTINGVNVLDLPHTEVVKTAQAGRDELELGVARVDEDGNSATGVPYLPENEDDEPSSTLDLALVRLDDSLRIIHSGYLYKLSRSCATIHTGALDAAHQTTTIERKWSRRWFVLRADACLYFFKTETDVRPLGAVLISGSQVLPGCSSDPKRPFAFSISSKNNDVALSSDNQDDFNRWTNVVVRCGQNPEQGDFWLDIARQRMGFSVADLIRLVKADCQGFLLKLDEKAKVWKKRYCILVDACLFLYSEDDSSSAKAALCLHGYRVQSVGGNLGGDRRHAFELIPPEHQYRYFYFVADTETEKKRWLASMEFSIDRWLKLSEDGI
eukprot:maker-scaffold153_size302544-snap-gene-1.8 protein:Tk03373 transcript:maker-scaffold153_size302544-snap-gene-1.8-mRNA-1 annotation:"serine threonine-protein kinase"